MLMLGRGGTRHAKNSSRQMMKKMNILSMYGVTPRNTEKRMANDEVGLENYSLNGLVRSKL
jgi:hypothetical protein